MSDPGVEASGPLARTAVGRALNLRFALGLVAAALVYLACAELSLLLAIAPGFATPVWPPSGIALAALLVYGMRLWPAIWAGAFAANLAEGTAWPAVAAIATGNTLEAIVACWLVRRMVGREVVLDRPESVFRFAGAVALAAMVAATVGVGALRLTGLMAQPEVGANAYTWWLGDTAGMLVVTPFLLAWLRPLERRTALSPTQRTELWAFAAALGAMFAIVLALVEQQSRFAHPLTFLLIAVVVWAGSRFSERVVTGAVLAISAVAVWATVGERGPFLFATMQDGLLALQAFLGTLAVTGLVLCVLNRKRRQAESALLEASGQLEAAVRARTEELEQRNRELAVDLAERARLSSALQRREAQLAEAQAITHIGSWNWDVGADRVTWSTELLRIFGLEGQELTTTFTDFLGRVHPDDRQRVNTAVRSALLSREPWESTKRIVRADGTVRLLRTLGGVWTDPAGEVSALYGASLDVTESTRRERVQAMQHEVTRVLVRAPDWPEAMRDSMRIVCETLDWALAQLWTVDAERDLIRFHSAWSRADAQYEPFVTASRALVFGKGQGLPGRTWQRAAPEWIEDRPEAKSGPRAPRAEQCALHAALCFPLTAGGRVLGVLEFFAAERRPPQDEVLPAVVALGSQLGEYIVRNRAERLLRESEERFRLLIEGVKEYAIVMLDPEGRVATWNSGAARINGYAAEEILGQDFARFHTDEDRMQKGPQSLLSAAIEHGSVEDEGWRVRRDGSRFWAHVSLTVLYGPDGALRGFAKVTRDMTERKQVEALEEAGRQTRQFLAMLGHELRNPLAPIRNAVGVMRMREIDDPQIKYCRDLIERQVTQLARLVDDLLDASRITTGVIGLQLERLDLAQVIALAVEASRPNIEGRRHTLDVDVAPEPIEVSADHTRLVQVVQNLLNNATKYTPEGGHIGLKVSREERMAVIEVRDDGMGIAPDMLPRIFELFIQGDGGLARTEGGLGVGLTLARRIIEMHGGSIQATSEGVGRGATFRVLLPALEPMRAASGPAAEAPRTGRASVQRTVLVVDDNHDAADSVAALLELRGHRVWVAYDSQEAIAIAAEHVPEVVLLDIGLPGMDGYAVAERLRAMAPMRSSTIVAVTGYGQEEDRRRSAQARFDAHLVKPVDCDTLYALIEEHRAPAGTGGSAHRTGEAD